MIKAELTFLLGPFYSSGEQVLGVHTSLIPLFAFQKVDGCGVRMEEPCHHRGFCDALSDHCACRPCRQHNPQSHTARSPQMAPQTMGP